MQVRVAAAVNVPAALIKQRIEQRRAQWYEHYLLRLEAEAAGLHERLPEIERNMRALERMIEALERELEALEDGRAH